jgi:hypothetical protein
LLSFYTVSGTADVTAATPVPISGTGTAPDPYVMQSLREAVIYANENDTTATIMVPAGTYQLSANNPGNTATDGTQALPDLEVGSHSLQTVTIMGTGGTPHIEQTIAGNDVITTGFSDALFTPAIVNLTLDHLEISGGTFTGIFTGADDGAGDVSQTTITNCNIHDNQNNSSSNLSAQGGAIFNEDGDLTVQNTTFTNNQSTDPTYGEGGAIFYFLPNSTGQGSQGNLLITNCTFTGNTAAGPAGSPAPGTRMPSAVAPSAATRPREEVTAGRSWPTGRARSTSPPAPSPPTRSRPADTAARLMTFSPAPP